MIRIVKFTKFAKSRFPKEYRRKVGVSKYINLLHSPMFYLFGKNHSRVNSCKQYSHITGRHIVRGNIIKYKYDSKKRGYSYSLHLKKIIR